MGECNLVVFKIFFYALTCQQGVEYGERNKSCLVPHYEKSCVIKMLYGLHVECELFARTPGSGYSKNKEYTYY